MKVLNKLTAPKAVAPEKIIQFGEGNFLRAFVDWIVKNMNDTTDFNASVVVLQGTRMAFPMSLLQGQDCMYHVNLQGRLNGEVVNSLTRIDCLSRGLNPYEQFDAYMGLADQPEIRFVISNTTEAGITFSAESKFTDTPCENYPARLTQLLYRRFKTFNGAADKGLIIMPCELIFENGHHLKDCINRTIDLWKEDLGADYDAFKSWFNTYNYVCATLVDRIVPGFPRKEINQIQEKLGYKDNVVVQGEAFHLWVIEKPDNMSIEELRAEFPAEKAGLNVIITDSEAPYHERKVTLLNGPHTVLSPVSYLSGVDIVRDACKYRQELTSTGDVITTVAGNPAAIGYASLASVKDTVKTLSVGGIVPAEETVKDGSYVVQRPFVLVTKSGAELSATAQKFFDYITSSEAGEIISSAGAVPVNK